MSRSTLETKRKYDGIRYGIFFVFIITYCIIFFLPVDRINFTICPFFNIFHLLCPFCGFTRSVYYTLHGDFIRAWHFHEPGVLFVILSVLCLPGLLSRYLFDKLVCMLRFLGYYKVRIFIFISGAFIFYWIIRNIF